ncbi:MAG: phosphoenolpyruvate synthase [Nitrospirae bacterium]|nr:phosphoenolpyruvate synthase [Nitrospirota bacterium]
MRFLRSLFKKPPHQDKRDEDIFKEKYLSFQNLLNKNNLALEIMADMEEKLSGEFLFDRQYIESNTEAVTAGVRDIIDSLNRISNDKYSALTAKFNQIVYEIQKTIERKKEIPVSGYTIPFDEITKEALDMVGGKNAHIGEVKNRIHIPTPDGFAVTAFAYKKFMEHNGFLEKINKRLSELQIDDMEQLNRTSKEMQDMVIEGEMPEDIEKAIIESVESLKSKIKNTPHPRPLPQGERGLSFISPPLMGGDEGEGEPSTVRVSVRSSALQEDGDFSFAGQYYTFLNVPEDSIIQKYKEVVASLFTPRAIFYYKSKGFQEYEMVMSVGVVTMVDAVAGGVMYSKDPNSPQKNEIIISAVRGLGKCAVEGAVTPETYIVSSHPEIAVKEKKIPVQDTMLICKPDGELKEVLLPDDMKGKPCLTDEQVKALAGYAVTLENHYNSPQDNEWATDKHGRINILQTRPLRVLPAEEQRLKVPTRLKGYNILIDKGVIASKGIGCGRAFILKKEEDLKDFPEGAVLVAKHTSTKFVTVMNKASAIITDIGGATGHMASLAREFQVPAILDTEIATDIIRDGQEITVDAVNCNIYEGRVDELLEFSKREEPFKGTELFKTLEKALKWVVPLNLVDPEDENFKPEFCDTLHDITRFCHETGMHEMFKIKDMPSGRIGEARRLTAGIPLSISLIDLGGGIKGNKKLLPEHICSIPFNAFFKGLASMRWPEPQPFDTKGFFGMIAHTATIPEQELRKTGEESFSFISREYINFSLRLGYHFSAVEAYAGENMNDNYIRFFFKGGGAITDRRLRRVRLITEILKKLDFRVKFVEDVIDASITKYKSSAIEEKLEILGKLTVYTKQLDMVMYNDAVTDWYIEEFVKGHMK